MRGVGASTDFTGNTETVTKGVDHRTVLHRSPLWGSVRGVIR